MRKKTHPRKQKRKKRPAACARQYALRAKVQKVQALAELPADPPQIYRSNSYDELIAAVTARIQAHNIRATFAVNHELVLMNWEVGKYILEAQRQEGWGSNIIDRLSADLTQAFPNVQGFSPRNLNYMRAFADTYRDRSIIFIQTFSNSKTIQTR
jgi:hypothetical protein